MARRTVWLMTGVVAGAASTLYAERKLRRTLEVASARLAPEALVSGVGRTARQAARSTGGRVRDAVTTGRTEMQRREEEIWAGLGSSPPDDGVDAVATVTRSDGGTDGTVTRVDGAPEDAPGGVPARTVRGPDRVRARRRARRSPSHLGK
jgi:hypothetical protein